LISSIFKENLDHQKNKKHLYSILIKELNKHEINSILALISENIEINVVGYQIYNGKIGASQFLMEFYQGFPDLSVSPITILHDNFSSNNLIVSEVDVCGHQMGSWNGNPSSGKMFSTKGAISIKLDVFEKIKKIVIYLNFKSIFRQLDILKI
jgi:hypothetical protein